VVLCKTPARHGALPNNAAYHHNLMVRCCGFRANACLPSPLPWHNAQRLNTFTCTKP